MTHPQIRTFVACFLGWTLDAFDFFLVIVLLPDLSRAFSVSILTIAFATTLTLALRPVGALLFGWLGDAYGRRRALMLDVGLYSFFALLTAFSPNVTFFFVVRGLFGIAMGGEWGLGAALAMEVLPPRSRGSFSGVLQLGYAFGNLLAGACLALLYVHVGWRGMFALGAVPALLVLFLRAGVAESRVWEAAEPQRLAIRGNLLLDAFKRNRVLVLYAVALMAALNFVSHGSQDPYVAFLSLQRGFSHASIGALNSIAVCGAIVGGIGFAWLSQRWGRRWMIVAACAFGLAAIRPWVEGGGFWTLAAGGFLMQMAVQGAWGIVPAHLNEIAPPLVRAAFPGFVYQFGNLIAAGTLPFVAWLASAHFALPAGRPGFGQAMAAFMLVALCAAIGLTLLGFRIVAERRDVPLGGAA